MDLDDLISQLSSPGDWGVTMLGYAIGFAVDTLVFPGGLSAGTVAGVTAIGAFGAKKTVESLVRAFKGYQLKRQETVERASSESSAGSQPPGRSNADILNAKTQALGIILAESDLKEQADVLVQEHRLWQLGLASDREFDATIVQLLRDYRVRSAGPMANQQVGARE